jgi:paired amphipathic helix protein Sin3a
VIERVSTLFRGHPALISGFNTFLPPGYRIECSTDDHARDIIKVTTPNGTTSTTSGEPLNLQSETSNHLMDSSSRYYNNGHPTQPPPPHQQQQQQPLYSSNNYRNSNNNGPLPPISSYHPPSHQQQQQHVPPPPPTSSSRAQQQQAPIHQQQQQDTSRSHSPPPQEGTRRAPVEFNHAINYVNKIKNRFSNDPETYKQFLEILQTYQKEQKPIQEVYAQVQILFNGANDLLAEFKQFLPDTSQPSGSTDFLQHQQPTTTATTKGGATKLKKRGLTALPKQPKRSKTYHKMMEHTLSDIRRSPIVPSTDDIRPCVTIEEAEFFDRVKKFIGNKATYHAFLRVLNLFSQQILDANLLIERCEPFLGGQKDLFDHLKKLVGYDGKDIVIENLPSSIPKPDFSTCQEYGPSYRSVPKSWQGQSCSGRDALCWEVLNDAYVSHPTWASEDSGFIASKKNLFEEALHRVEEERYDYDINIEANLNTISLLEPIAKKISALSEEEKSSYKLPPGLGGPSKAIYQRVIKKIYGKEQGQGVVDMLHSNPATAVPIILKRLKQKDEEWKKSQVRYMHIIKGKARNSNLYLFCISENGIRYGERLKSKIITRHWITKV